MELSDFLRLYALRSQNIMWFLGAGASVSSRMPSAQDMLWDFKRSIYCSEQRRSISSCADLFDPVVQARLQQYFDAKSTLPPQYSPDEYPAYFEYAYPSSADRRRLIERYVLSATPSYGYKVLGVLLALRRCRLVWTTNFDTLVEDSTGQYLLKTSDLTVVTLDSPHTALQMINEERFPLLVKLHGDFKSERLKNIAAELRTQDERLRESLIEASQRFGLVVMGYSGRDLSIMAALREAAKRPNSFPFGFYWLSKIGDKPNDAVAQLIRELQAAGKDAHVIPISNFDETLGDVFGMFDDIPANIRQGVEAVRGYVSDAPEYLPGTGWPILRLNALSIDLPGSARLVNCEIGGTKEVRSAITAAGTDIVATRTRNGVLAFGADDEIRRTFRDFGIREFLHQPITYTAFSRETGEKSLVLEALSRALSSHAKTQARKRHSSWLVLAAQNDAFTALAQACKGDVVGSVPRTSLRWFEACEIRIEMRYGRTWLLLIPTVYCESSTSPEQQLAAKDFVRERLATRYNRDFNECLEAWVQLFAGRTLRAFGLTSEGTDAAFSIGDRTAYSRPNTRTA